MRILLVIFFSLLATRSEAGVYFGPFGGIAGQSNESTEHPVSGFSYGGKLGLRTGFAALEASWSKMSLKAEPEQTDDYNLEELSTNATVKDLGLRLFLLRYLSLYGAWSWVDSEEKLHLTNIGGTSTELTATGEIEYKKSYVFGVGLHLPLGKTFEIWLDVYQRFWDLDSSQAAEYGLEDIDTRIKIQQVQIGFVWHFGGGPSKASQPSTSEAKE